MTHWGRLDKVTLIFVVSVAYFYDCTQHVSLTAPVSCFAELLPSTQRRHYTVGVLVVRCAVQTVVASCERVEGDRLNRARRIAQSQRTHDGLLAIIDKSHVARTCSIRAFFCAVFGGMGLQMTCCRSLALRLFCIRLFALIEVSRGPSFNLSSICMRPDSYTELANNYLSRLFLFLCSWELALFPSVLYHCRILFLWRVLLRFLSSGVFLHCDQEMLDFEISLCENLSFNQGT